MKKSIMIMNRISNDEACSRALLKHILSLLQVSGYERERYAEEAEQMNERGVVKIRRKDSSSDDSDSSSDDTPSDDDDEDDAAPRERISRQ